MELWQWYCRNRKKKICDKLIVAMPLLKQGEKKNCGNGIAEIGRKKNCENLIVAMPLPKQGNKKQFQQLWQWHCRKWGEKKSVSEIYGRVKKKCVMSTIFLQHFHNKSHVISYYQFKKIL